ncbi:MAG TPA: HAD family hydrolase [Erysipelothrix sp.]|nr:HAD family hydrolase [Erysipelothrix sp.]
MIKLVATDMDGTLLDNDSLLPDNIVEVLDLLDSKDIPFVAASGRSLHSIEDKFQDLSKRICIVSDNGAVVKHKGDIVFSSVISKDDWLRIGKASLASKETSVVFIGIDKAFRIVQDDSHADMLNDYFGYSKVIQSMDEIDVDIIKVTLLSLNSTKDNYDSVLNPQFGSEFNVVFGGEVWTDFMNKNVNKGTGLSRLLDLYKIDSDSLAAFGDYHNDIEMLQLANHSYAVDNAHPVVKSVSKTVIGKNSDNAVLNKVIELVG